MGAVLIATGVTIEFATCGAYTIGFGIQAEAGLGLILSGAATLSYEAKEMRFNKTISLPTTTKYVPGDACEFTYMAKENVRTEIQETIFEKRSSAPGPDPRAEGNPHTVIEKPGPEGQYTTHNSDGTWKQYRGSGKPHGPVPRPNVKENENNPSPYGPIPGSPKVREPRNDEIPGKKI